MLALYLIAAHMVGDFVFQNRWMAAHKLHDRRYRLEHVAAYSAAFIPVAVIYSENWRWAVAFMLWLSFLHYLTDSHRFQSTLGDVIQWRIDTRNHALVQKQAWIDHVVGSAPSSLRAVDIDDEAVWWPTPNPWPQTPLMIDQSLHLCQLAILGGLLLS